MDRLTRVCRVASSLAAQRAALARIRRSATVGAPIRVGSFLECRRSSGIGSVVALGWCRFDCGARVVHSRICGTGLSAHDIGRGEGTGPDSNYAKTCSLRCARLLSFESFSRCFSSRNRSEKHARDRIRTGGPLRDSVLSAAPLAWLGYPRALSAIHELSKKLSIRTTGVSTAPRVTSPAER